MVNMLHTLTVYCFVCFFCTFVDGDDDGYCDVLSLCSFLLWYINIRSIDNAFVQLSSFLLYFFLFGKTNFFTFSNCWKIKCRKLNCFRFTSIKNHYTKNLRNNQRKHWTPLFLVSFCSNGSYYLESITSPDT